MLLLRLHTDQLMDLHEFNRLNGLPSFDLIKAQIAGRDIKLCPVLDSRFEFSNEVSKKLKKLERADRFILEERGSNDLHIGWPMARGKFADGTPVRCPLLFFPVSLHQENNQWYLRGRPQAGITFNKSFLLAYAFYNQVKLNEDLLDTSFEDFSTDSTVFRTELYQLLKDDFEINFNPDNFRDELTPFQEFKRNEFEAAHRNGEIKLYPEAVLGIFPQAGSQLVPDYMHLIAGEAFKELEEFFLSKTSEEGHGGRDMLVIRPLKEEKIHAPFSLDAYQENVIRAVKNGRSLVVQGPPGTGKSQLICNLMADAIASGKRVLLVCQKRAALDVVYDRLQSRQLGSFVGLVHDFRNERKGIFAKIAKQIDSIEDYKALNRSVDIIYTERRFFQVCRRIDQITEELDQFKHALFDDKECGLSIKELYLTSDLQAEAIGMRQEYQFFHFNRLPDFLRKLKQYVTYSALFTRPDYAWRDRISFSRFTVSDMKEMEQAITDVVEYQEQLQNEIRKLVPVTLTLEECESFCARQDDVLGMIALLQDETIYEYFQTMAEVPEEETSLLWLANVERMVMNCFEGLGPEATLAPSQLVKFQEALHRRMEVRRNIIRLIRWKLFSKDKAWIDQVLTANQLPYSKKGLRGLERKIDNRLNLEHHLTALKQRSWLLHLPLDYKQSSLKAWFNHQKLAIRAKLIFNSLREIRDAVSIRYYSQRDFIKLLKNLLGLVSGIADKKREWLRYLTPYQVRLLTYEPMLGKEFLRTLHKDFESLCEFDRLSESLRSYEKDVIQKLYEAAGGWNYEAQERILQNSLRLAWIEHIEAKYPNLRSVSSLKMEEQREELRQLVEEKQKLSQTILLMRARERVYEEVEYNRLNNRVTYRDLYHQVTKKKKIWPLRKVITEFEQDLFKVMPCWMASPEAVSAIFPMREIFDLVIFDEASQCFAERGIPAMYRGKQVLIAGDSMQLKPYELYQVRWEEDSDHPDLEVDSLLDLAERYLPTLHLQGHYRSQTLELIDFSNHYFYEGRLQLLPDRHILNRQQPGIEYCHVAGVWENQTNPVEAQHVVQRVMALLRETPDKEIGIVTFNAPQQMLILDMLEEEFSRNGMAIPSGLFIKNIENVQGDEKDIIIFSVGYAPDKRKKMNMQFGSLSMPGGENRLNVAITRAREKIILVSSIWPEDLRTADLKNEGPKLLKKYLEFARQVSQREFKPTVKVSSQQSESWYLNTRLKEWAERKFQQVQFETGTLPLADLHFRSNGHYLGVIFTDDLRYFESLSVKDSFAYVPTLFTQKNWEYHYIFSRNLWQDREKAEDDLLRFIGSRVEQ